MILPITTLPLSSRHRVSQITFHPTLPYLAVQSHDRSIEIFRIRTEEEVRKKQARRKKRAKEKKEQGKSKSAEEHEIAEDETSQSISLADLFIPYLVARASGKVRSFNFGDEQVGSKGKIHLFCALSTNALEVYSIPPPTKSKDDSPEAPRILSVDLPGHRTDVRALCLSSDDALLASASNGMF